MGVMANAVRMVFCLVFLVFCSCGSGGFCYTPAGYVRPHLIY
jgi:hypothetical protein